MTRYRISSVVFAIVAVVCSLTVAKAQDSVTVLLGQDLTRVIPPGFYFQGLSAPTQTRNSAAARFGSNRYVISGFVDTSGYSSEIREKYQGLLQTHQFQLEVGQ